MTTKPTARRFEKRAKKLAAKKLPYAVNTALIQEAGLTTDAGLGRVLYELMTASQGNFDHMQTQLEEYTRYHNEHAEETNFLKDELLPHEHARFRTGQAVGRGAWHHSMVVSAPIAEGFWAATNRLVPVFIEEACTVEYMSVYVTTTGTSDIRACIYAGDNEGFLPGSLIHDAGLIDGSGTGNKYTGGGSVPFDAHLGAGRWYWFGVQEDPAAGTSVELDGYDSEDAEALGINFNSWWPFPSLTADPVSLGTLSVNTSDWAMDADPPAWAGDIDAFTYSNIAPFIAYRVR